MRSTMAKHVGIKLPEDLVTLLKKGETKIFHWLMTGANITKISEEGHLGVFVPVFQLLKIPINNISFIWAIIFSFTPSS